MATSGGCSRESPNALVGRLWVDHLPTGPRDDVHAFFLVEAKGKVYGVMHRGSAFRARYDAFLWTSDDDRATLELLQDGETYTVRISTCEPSEGFDRCVLLRGHPSGTERYQSRKRWAIRARDQAPTWEAAIGELAATDESVSSLIEDLDR